MKGVTCPSIDKRAVNLRIPLELAELIEIHFASDDASGCSAAYIRALESVAGADPLTEEDLRLIEEERKANRLRNERALARRRKGM